MKKTVVKDNLPQEQRHYKKVVTYAIFIACIFVSALMVVFKVYEYRQDYRQMTTYLKEQDDLNAEWGRLLIEQQTFGATSQIGTRAVTQLRMYSPPASSTVVISLPLLEKKK